MQKPNLEIEKILSRSAEVLQQRDSLIATIKAKAEELFFDDPNSSQAAGWVALQRELVDLEYQHQVLELRKENGKILRQFSIWWTIAVLGLIVIKGATTFFSGKEFLSDNLLLALIGGTTLNILGLYAIVIRNLFPSHSNTNN